jgi:glycosyltransferase involved in cell wall biosynthesis
MYQGVLGVPMNEQSIVIETPIEPIDFYNWNQKPLDQLNLVYTSTPQRGLDILVPVFVELAKKHKHIHLHVFSSFDIYGWKDADKQFEEIFKVCREHPQITYHGAQPNDVVRKQLIKSHIFAYPSTWMECNSRSLIEAMSAGLLPVVSDLGGIPDTAGGMAMLYSFHDDKQKHANIFYQRLDLAIQEYEDTRQGLVFVKAYADARFSIDKIISNWRYALQQIREDYQGNTALPEPRLRIKI